MTKFSSRGAIVVQVTVTIGLLFSIAGCSTPKFTPRLQAVGLDIDGNLGAVASAGPIAGGLVSSADALGLGRETVVQPAVDVDWGKLDLRVMGWKADYSGSGRAEARLQLGDLPPIEAETPVLSDVGIGYYIGKLTFDLIPTKYVDIGLGLGGGVATYDLAVQSQISDVRLSTSNSIPFGFPMLRLASHFGPFGLIGTLGGIGVSFSDFDVSYLEADIGGSYRIFGKDSRIQGHIIGGYQYFKLDLEYEDRGTAIIDVELSGPYLGFGLTF